MSHIPGLVPASELPSQGRRDVETEPASTSFVPDSEPDAGTRYPRLFAALTAPFKEGLEVKTRPGKGGGKGFPYITARTVMNRFDSVLGPENWWDEYLPMEHSVICRLTIRLPDGSTVTKSDAGGVAGMADAGDDDKSGFSDAFKRAAVRFGVGRYLYGDGVPSFAGDGGETVPHRGSEQPSESRRAGTPSGGSAGAPRTGKALYAWAKEQEDRQNVKLVGYLNQYGKLHGFPGKMIEWSNDQAAQAYTEASRKLAARDPSAAREPSDN